MSGRGRKAALPSEEHHRPVVRRADGLVVRHEDGRSRSRVYDFAELPVAEGLQQMWATLFAARCRPGGGWESVLSSTSMWLNLRRFAFFLAAQERADAVSAGVWNAYRMARQQTATGRNEMAALASFLRSDPALTTSAREALSRRVMRLPAKEEALSPQEFDQVRAAARRTFRAAVLRIEHNAALLAAWRSGACQQGSPDWLVGEVLDALAQTGRLPPWEVDGYVRVPYRYGKALGGGGVVAAAQRLFLSPGEAAALAVLLVAEFGLNATTVSDLRVPRIVSAAAERGPGAVYRLELEKRRRGNRLSTETRNVADWGADSPGRLITQTLQATGPARTCVEAAGGDAGRLLIWREATDSRRRSTWQGLRVGPFGLGLADNQVDRWGRSLGWPGSPLRRIRRTVNVLHRQEPGQNSQDTHDVVYVLREPQARQAAVPVIAAGAAAAVEAARATLVRARLTDAGDPGDQMTVIADCADFTHSPLTPEADGCAASFMMCTACPNARVHPGHHARLAHLHRAISNLRAVLPLESWERDWGPALARLEDLRNRIGTGPWQHALARVSDADRDDIDSLMKGHFDQ